MLKDTTWKDLLLTLHLHSQFLATDNDNRKRITNNRHKILAEGCIGLVSNLFYRRMKRLRY